MGNGPQYTFYTDGWPAVRERARFSAYAITHTQRQHRSRGKSCVVDTREALFCSERRVQFTVDNVHVEIERLRHKPVFGRNSVNQPSGWGVSE